LHVLAPFERNRKFFYLKSFAPKFVASGIIRVGGMEYSLNENTSRAYFDSTRFSKPFRHKYFRLSADYPLDGRRVSLCLASRIGDNRYGNENCFFTDGALHKLAGVVMKGNKRLDRPFFFTTTDKLLDVTFKPFTVGGASMAAAMLNTTVIFGRLYGEIRHKDIPTPLIVDNMQAHLIFSEL
ncbi:MAG: DUF2804 family protein, partial [Ruminococcus sp.]|nr:DUF2804 family protein [Ruminococcus sp.]